ncbi:MAG: hypothetical protein E6J91_12390 [Deltaproteobacteria bacterium]|nr:MAG: hypothetical protein E6J91_12390 [Deltaproteobacteria bacterium]
MSGGDIMHDYHHLRRIASLGGNDGMIDQTFAERARSRRRTPPCVLGTHGLWLQALGPSQGLELAEANKVGNPPHPPELVWEFPRGVTRSVKAALEAIEVNGRHIRVVGQIVDPVNPPLPVPPPPHDKEPQ